MDELRALRPHGVFLRRDAVMHGWTDHDLRRACVAGDIRRLRHGAYVHEQTWDAASPERQHCLVTHATLLLHGAGYVASHTSAALLHELDTWGVDLARVHVTRPDAVGGRRHRLTAHHQALATEQTSEIDGTRVVGIAAAALGTAMVSSVEAGVVVVDSAYRTGRCSTADLQELVSGVHHWPGVARLQVTMRLAQPGSGSVGESRARVMFARHRVPRPLLQFPVYDDRGLIGLADFAWPSHGALGEFDGRGKYDELRRPGETPADVLFREKQREDRMRAAGWKFVRLTWNDLNRPRESSARVRHVLGL